MTAATVFVVDDDAAVRSGLSLLLETAGFEVEAHASAVDFLESFEPGRPGCLLLDVRMPQMSGPELQGELNRRGSLLPIIFLTAHGDVATTAQSFKAGACDFLTKPVESSTLLAAVQAALHKDAQRREQASATRAQRARVQSLTEREREIMVLVVSGRSSKQIAQDLGISHRTVEIHRTRVMQKTGAANLMELFRIAESCGYVAGGPVPPS
jgi:FixJ family two-component response regulator